MSTDFFSKRILRVACAIAVAVVAAICVYAISVKRAYCVDIRADFYFLVTDATSTEAGAAFARLDGGAGYLLQEKDRECVALSVYTSKRAGEAVQESLQKQGEETRLVYSGVKTLRFRGKAKARANEYLGALRTFQGELSVLDGCIARLERGMTQEDCKRTLSLLIRQIAFTAERYTEYAALARICRAWEKDLTEICKKTVYLKDLRYQLCQQVENYVGLCEEFSI